MGKSSKLRLTIQDLKDLGIIKYKKKRKHKRNKKKKIIYRGHNMDGIKSSSNHLVGYGSVLTNTPTLQLNNENAVMQRDANIKAIKNQDESRMVSYNPQLRQIEDNYNDMKGAITHLWNVNNHYGSKEPRIEEIDDDEEENVDIFTTNRNDYKYDSKDTVKSSSSDDFLVDGDKTPSMINEVFQTPQTFETRAGGGMTNKRTTKQPPAHYEFNPADFPPEGDEDVSILSVPEEKAEEKKVEKKGAPNLNVSKIELQKMYSEFGGDDVKLLTAKAKIQELRAAIRLLPEYKGILKYTKSNK